jgi:hypothetical protein
MTRSLSTYFKANVTIDPVTSTAVHSSGTVVATCSGQRRFPDASGDLSDEESDGEEYISDEDDTISDQSSSISSKVIPRTPDNSIKLWSL